MKKILALLLALVMVLSLAACGAKEPAAEAPKADAPAAETPKAEDTGIELTYWSMWNSTEGQAAIIQEAADAYYHVHLHAVRRYFDQRC